MPKLIIFDLDGTLLDTIDDLGNSANYALQQHRFPTHPTEAYRFFVGNGIAKLLKRALPEEHRTPDMVAMLKHDFIHYYFAHADQFTKPYPGVEDLLASLHSEGYLLAVASNKVHEATVDLVQRFFPAISFIAIRGQREGFPIKPNPAILEEIMQIAGVERSEVLYVGDSGVDAATAYNAKTPFTGVLWGFRPQKELEEAGATSFVATADELYRMIRQKTPGL